MKDRNKEFAQQWLKKADHDLITARQTLALSSGPTDTPCFHSQQAIEKALKGLLTFHGITFRKIHDLMLLLDMVSHLLPTLENYRESFEEISGYAVEVRYPSEWLEPTRTDAMQALVVAEQVVEMVVKTISVPFL